MRIGIINMPGRKGYEDQSLRTRFFILGLPLFPTGCYYKISDNLGINIPLKGEDILHAFAKIHFGLLGVAGLMWSSSLYGASAVQKTLLILVSLLLLGFCLYSWMMHSQVQGEEEIAKRRIFGKAFLYNMSPEYLPKNVQQSLFGELMKTYFGKFNKMEWQAEIHQNEVNKENFPLLYTLAYYQKTLQPTATNEALFSKIEAYLEKRKTSTTGGYAKNATADTRQNFADASFQKESQQHAFQSQSAKSTAQTKTATAEPMSSQDAFKLHDARDEITKQLLMVGGFFLIGFVITAVLSGQPALLGTVLIICLVLYGSISAIVFIPSYLRIRRDLKNRQKIKINVRIKDMTEEFGTAYLVLKPNTYGIKKLTAPAKYYSTALLNQELEIYVAKESHTLLEIVGARY
ncbi:MAG: hypothetical protein AAFZ63_15935 [Bacteroidota bacterium]